MPGLAVVFMVLAFAVSAGLVRAAIGYAHRRGMLDQPGQRRSHAVPTPRGGGIGIVVAMLLALPPCLRLVAPLPWPVVAMAWTGLLLVAAIGWWDDHHSLPVWPRILVQAVAAAAFATAMATQGVGWAWLPVLLVAGVGSINLHNFMDGIDGLLAQQGIFVFLGTAAVAAERAPAVALAALAAAAASAGFWLFNRSPARIFMGDVGSGSLGFLVFVLDGLIWSADRHAIWSLAVLNAAFVVDAALTLAVRVWRGRRWYSAHREHLYQWLVRKGATHRQVGRAYMAWNVAVCAPMAWLALRPGSIGWAGCIAAYGLCIAVWIALKRRCLRRGLYGKSHVGT